MLNKTFEIVISYHNGQTKIHPSVFLSTAQAQAAIDGANKNPAVTGVAQLSIRKYQSSLKNCFT